MSLWTEVMHTPHELKFVDAGGLRTRALVAGTGEPLIFLHGVSGHIEAYFPSLAPHAQHFQVHLIDMLGHGYSDKPDGDYTIETYGDHVLAYMDAVGIERAHISGLSLGGWVTGYLAGTYPERLLSATMTCSAGSPAMADPAISEAIRKMTAAAVNSDDREFTRSRLEALFSDKSRLTEEMIDVRFGIYQQPEFRAHIESVLALTDLEVYRTWMLDRERLARIETEVLLIWSEDDLYSAVQGAAHFVEHIPHNRLVVLPDCGHWPPFERPDLFCEYSLAFLRGGLDAVPAGLTRTLEPSPAP